LQKSLLTLLVSLVICKSMLDFIYTLDRVGFTRISSDMNPTELVGMLNFIVNGFDNLTDRYMLEKIKTIGDAYFCVG